MTLEDILEEIRTRLEEKAKRQLSGLQGFVVGPVYNSIMPLHVKISINPEVFEFVFLNDGVVELSRGHGSNTDLHIETDTSTFMSLLQNPTTERFKELEKQSKIRITPLTKKGSDALGHIRRYLIG